MTDYPTSFYIAHHKFRTLSGQPWGDISDGPRTDAADVITDVCEAFKDAPETLEDGDVRVWHIANGKAEDVTEWAVDAAKEKWVAAFGERPWAAE